jgi:hypothetical protein
MQIPIMLLFLFVPVLLIVLSAAGLSDAYKVEGRKVLLLLLLVVPWMVDLILGYGFAGHPGRSNAGPFWVGPAILVAALANPVLWGLALVRFRGVRRQVAPFLWFNVLIAPFAALIAALSHAGASL